MKRLFVIPLLLAGCATTPEPTPSPQLSIEQRFVQNYESEFGLELDESQEIALLRLREVVCDALNDVEVITVVEFMIGDGLDPDRAGWLIAESVRTKCPEHDLKVRRFVAAYT